MVVIVIMGILAALVVPRLLDRPDQARAVAARQDISALMQALAYRLDTGSYPSTEQDCARWWSGRYGARRQQRLARLSGPPAQRSLGPSLSVPESRAHGEIDVFSYGADGKPDGEAGNADIGSWQL